jgi:PAS domain S-box-containing protein
VLELLPDAVLIVAGVAEGGQILYANTQAGAMFGYAVSDLVNQSIDILVPLGFRPGHGGHRARYSEAPTLRPMGRGLSLHGLRRDGTEFPVDVLLRPMNGGGSAGTIAIARDMTERNRLEEALTLARDSAVRANEIKSRFLAAASHDLRQPLQTIWSLQAVLSRAHQNTEYAAHCALLEDAVRSMDQMLSSLIDINRLEEGAIHPVIRDFPLEEILPRLRSEYGYAASTKSLTLEIEQSGEFARSDPMLLPVILRNLLANAIKYTPHGSVSVKVRIVDSQLSIDVSDSGPGIPPEHRARLFEVFYQVDNPREDQRQGVGLGLSIVQTICRLLDHTVTIHSEPGHGSVFTVTLPRGAASQPPAPITLSPAAAVAPLQRKAMVLHIEDDPGVARSMAMLLRLEGYEVIGAASRDEAFELAAVDGVRPDLILSDLHLPMGVMGDDLVTDIAKILGMKPPTIILTGDINDRHVQKARLVADRIMPKPVDANLLLREIEGLLAERAERSAVDART